MVKFCDVRAERAQSEHRRPARGRHLPRARPGAVQVRRRTRRLHPLYHATAAARARRYVSLSLCSSSTYSSTRRGQRIRFGTRVLEEGVKSPLPSPHKDVWNEDG